MTLSPTALEAACTAWLENASDYTRLDTSISAAITAYLAQMEKEGRVMVPTNATAQMIAAAFPSTDRDVLSSEDLKTGAAAIMILEGPADLGAITGPAVKEAAAMCKDYRSMLAAAQNGGDLPAPPRGE